MHVHTVKFCELTLYGDIGKQESPADADKPARLKRIQNCSNLTCFVSFHRIQFPQISNYQCISSRGMFS